MFFVSCNLTQVQLLTVHMPIPEARVGRKERCFNQKSSQSEEMVTCVQRPSPKILLIHDNV